jgi:O-succinylbenzoic acid--CoA ligase
MRPLPGTELRILADDREAATGEAGEILVRGPTVMQGYLHRPEETARALRDGWLHTGDIGCLDEQGGLQVLDRREDLIVSGGENVYPAEVEAVLQEHRCVAEAAVAGAPDPDLGARVVAWIVLRPDAAMDVASLHRHCREHLAGFKQPREFRRVDSLPRNAAGKLQRKRLPGSGTPS